MAGSEKAKNPAPTSTARTRQTRPRQFISVATTTDSKVILGNGGAEKLVGKGDMLLLGPTASSPK